MISTDFTVKTIVESLFSISGLITGLLGMLISLLMYKLKFLRKKTWFGNSCSVWTGIICIAIIIFLLTSKLFWLLPCILLIPAIVVVGRYYWLEYRKKEVLKYSGLLDYDIKRYKYYVWLSKKELFRWEVKKYLLPAMNILFEIGAIHKLDDELEKLDGYKEWYEWKRLKSYVYWNRHEYREMIDMVRLYENDRRLSESERARTSINLFSAYRILEDKEGVEVYVKKLEKLLYEKKSYWVEAFDDLMYYYDEHGDEEKIEQLTAVINGLNFKEYNQWLEVYDVLYFYNRRHGKIDANRELLDRMVEKSCMMTDEERKRIFELRLLKLYFENDYGWKEYSIILFNDADSYLNYSRRVAFEYLRVVNQMVQDCRLYNINIGEGIKNLYGKILLRIEEYVGEFGKDLIELPDDFLYRKKEMLTFKMEYLKAKTNEQLEFKGYVTELSNTLHNIIALCEKAGDEREKLHFLMVLADEMVAFREDINAFKNKNNLTPDEMDIISDLNEDMNIARVEALECVQEMSLMLKKYHYERTLAYNIFYAAYLNMKLNNKGMAGEMLARFHATGVDIKHYALAVQELYKEVKKQVANV